MKRIILAFTLMLSGFVIQNTNAQIRITINIGQQPIWGPVGYDHVECIKTQKAPIKSMPFVF